MHRPQVPIIITGWIVTPASNSVNWYSIVLFSPSYNCLCRVDSLQAKVSARVWLKFKCWKGVWPKHSCGKLQSTVCARFKANKRDGLDAVKLRYLYKCNTWRARCAVIFRLSTISRKNGRAFWGMMGFKETSSSRARVKFADNTSNNGMILESFACSKSKSSWKKSFLGWMLAASVREAISVQASHPWMYPCPTSLFFVFGSVP